MLELHVFKYEDDYTKIMEIKKFRSFWLREAYMKALRNKYSDETFRSIIYVR